MSGKESPYFNCGVITSRYRNRIALCSSVSDLIMVYLR